MAGFINLDLLTRAFKNDDQTLPENSPKVSADPPPNCDKADYYYKLSRLIWDIAMLSLPLDALLLFSADKLRYVPISSESLSLFMAAVLLLTLVFSATEFWLEALYKLKRLREEYPNFRRVLVWSGVALATAMLLIELYATLRRGTVERIAAILLAYAGAAWGLFSASVQPATNQDGAAAKAVSGEEEVFYLSLVMIFLGRLVSCLGALYAVRSGAGWSIYFLGLLAALLLLFVFLPQRENFISSCKGCAKWTSRAWQSSGFCLACSQRLAPEDFTKVRRERGDHKAPSSNT
ncbi:MAG: hypothetical protein GX589_08175 [Deltaproteobacteria bacterium]|nr:hypothetical protein [Deltaproteobacteria bacterium]